MEEKNELDALREKLLYKQKQGYDIIDVDERIKLEEYATAYKGISERRAHRARGRDRGHRAGRSARLCAV